MVSKSDITEMAMKLYDDYDKDNNGYLDRTQVKQIMNTLFKEASKEYQIDEAKANKMFAACDINGDNKLSRKSVIETAEQRMQTTERIKEEIYKEVETSGFLKNVQAQVKAHVLDIIDKDTQNNKSKLGFQYEHPLLGKLKKYPLTSLCMDLIQQFLESFKFQHTLNVFKKEINRKNIISRGDLAQQFKIEVKNPTSQAVLLSIVSQLVNGDIQVKSTNQNNEVRRNNFISNDNLGSKDKQKFQTQTTTQSQNQNQAQQSFNQTNRKQPENKLKTEGKVPDKAQPRLVDQIKSKKQQEKIQQQRAQQQKKQKDKQEAQLKKKKQETAKVESSYEEDSYQEKMKQEKKKKQEQAEKETSVALLAGITGKFALPQKRQKSPEQEFQSRRAYSAPKEKKAPPPQAGTNKIRGASVGKGINSFLSKFSSFNQPKQSSSYVDEEMDEFQQSKDSTKRNPLFSSGQSGFNQSGFDESVNDSNAMDNYQYVEKAKKMAKKL